MSCQAMRANGIAHLDSRLKNMVSEEESAGARAAESRGYKCARCDE